MSYEFAEGYKIRDQSSTHFLTFTVICCIEIFSRKRYKDIIIDRLNYYKQNKGLQIGGYVIMTNHIHFIWTTKNNNLSDVVRDFKTFTSKAILKAYKKNLKAEKIGCCICISFMPIEPTKMQCLNYGQVTTILKPFTQRNF